MNSFWSSSQEKQSEVTNIMYLFWVSAAVRNLPSQFKMSFENSRGTNVLPITGHYASHIVQDRLGRKDQKNGADLVFITFHFMKETKTSDQFIK